MKTAATCTLPFDTSVQPWWRRIALALPRVVVEGRLRPAGGQSGVSRRPLGSGERELMALDGLSARTLRDIGAPDWMVDDARRRGPSPIEPASWR